MRVRRVPRRLTSARLAPDPASGNVPLILEGGIHAPLTFWVLVSHMPRCRAPPRPSTSSVSPPPSRFAVGATTPLRGVCRRQKQRRSRHAPLGCLLGETTVGYVAACVAAVRQSHNVYAACESDWVAGFAV
jgi:hypothetical protein